MIDSIEAAAEREFGEAGPEISAAEAAPEAAAAPGRSFDFSFLKAKTGPGPIEDYINHPMNFNGGRAAAQILRGLTGLLGALDLAIIDILIGTIQAINDRKKAEQAPEEKGGWHYVE